MTMRPPMDLRRRPPHRSTKRSMMIAFTERLEEDYFHWVKKRLGHDAIPLVKVNRRSDLRLMIEEVTQLHATARRDGTKYDEVWCVAPGVHGESDALELSTRPAVRVAVTRPDIASWLMYHFVDDVPAAGSSVAELEVHLPGVSAGTPDALAPLAGRFEEARTRVESRVGKVNDGQPYEIFHLVDSIRESSRSYRGLESLPEL